MNWKTLALVLCPSAGAWALNSGLEGHDGLFFGALLVFGIATLFSQVFLFLAHFWYLFALGALIYYVLKQRGKQSDG